MIDGTVLDASAIVDVAAGSTVYRRAFLDTTIRQGRTVVLPAAAWAEAWAVAQPEVPPFLNMLEDLPATELVSLGASEGRAAGLLAHAAGRPDALAAAHAVNEARTRWLVVLTGGPRDGGRAGAD